MYLHYKGFYKIHNLVKNFQYIKHNEVHIHRKKHKCKKKKEIVTSFSASKQTQKQKKNKIYNEQIFACF